MQKGGTKRDFMQEKEWHRDAVIGIVVASIFFGWWLRGFLYNWRFSLFSLKSWQYVANEFEAGWQPSSTSDWVFLATLFLAMPVFLYLWYLCTKVRWRRLIKKILKPIVNFFKNLFGRNGKKSRDVVLAPPPPLLASKNAVLSPERPRPIGYTMGPTVAPVFKEEEEKPIFDKHVSSQPMPVSADQTWNPEDFGDDLKNMPLENIELPQREAVVEDIPALFSLAGYQLVSDVQTSLQNLDFVAIGAERIYAILIDREPGDWLAEEEPFNGEAPLWFSEVDHRVSPIYELRQSVAELRSKIESQFPSLPIYPFMIEEKGNIINAEEMIKIWQEMDVTVSRTDVGGTEDLMCTSEAIKSTTPASVAEIEGITKLLKGGA